MLVVVWIEIEVTAVAVAVDAVVELVAAAVAVDAIVIVVDMPFDVQESKDPVVIAAAVAAVAVVSVVVDETELQPAAVVVLEQPVVEVE